MKVQSIELFKLPIDNTYKNVFDFNNRELNTSANLYAKINTLFGTDKYTIYGDYLPAISRYINENKNIAVNCEILSSGAEVTFSNPTDLYKYNYAIIRLDDMRGTGGYIYLFYFIIDLKINNSTSPKLGLTLYLEWDAWNNNINALSRLTNEVFCERRTIEKSAINENETHLWESYSLSKSAEEVDLHTQIDLSGAILTEDFRFYDIDTDQYRPCKILWQRVWLDDEATIIRYDNTNYDDTVSPDLNTIIRIAHDKIGCIPAILPIRCVYIPVAVVYTDTREICKDIKRYGTYINVLKNTAQPDQQPIWTQTYQFTEVGYLALTNFKRLVEFTKSSTHILNTDLTFHSPEQLPTITLGGTGNDRVLRFGGTADTFGDAKYGYILDKSSNFIYGFVRSNYLQNPLITSIYKEKLFRAGGYYREYITDIENYYNSVNDSDKKKIIAPLHMYPYEYYTLIAGDRKIDLAGNSVAKNYKIKYTNINRTNLALNVCPDDEEMSNHFKYIYANNNGNVAYSVDSLDQYLRDNAGKLTAQQLASIFAFASASLAASPIGVAGGIAAGAGMVARNIANLVDADRAQDDYKKIENFAIDEIEYQDDIIIVKNTIKNPEDERRILRDIHNYGIFYNGMANLYTNFFANFDYIKTVDCELPTITNNSDREKLISAFDNGITKWHLDTCNPTEIKVLSKQFCNLPLVLYNTISQGE